MRVRKRPEPLMAQILSKLLSDPLTDANVAKALGCTRSYANMIRRGLHEARLTTLTQYVQALKPGAKVTLVVVEARSKKRHEFTLEVPA